MPGSLFAQMLDAAAVLKMPHVIELPDGSVGYCMDSFRRDDCFQAAIATVTQVPIDEVPDFRIDERWGESGQPAEISRQSWNELRRWAQQRGLRIIQHRKVPARKRRWIGIVPKPGWFNDHCLVMSRDELLFDPAVSVVVPLGMKLEPFAPSDITSGISFERSSTCQ